MIRFLSGRGCRRALAALLAASPSPILAQTADIDASDRKPAVTLAQAEPGAQLPRITVESPTPPASRVRRVARKPSRAPARRVVHAGRPARATPVATRIAAPAPAGAAVGPAEGGVSNGGTTSVYAKPPVVQRYQLPVQSTSITSKQIEETINLKDPEDAIKYFPSLFVRKRNDGDNQAVLATRTWGLNSSARTLIYADDVLLSALINNNNGNGSPHWNLVSPDAIERIDFLNGPYAAAYPGNSIGGVLIITTKMPDHLIATAKQTESVQSFSQYGTHGLFATHQTSASMGDRIGPFAWLASVNFQDSFAQPLTFTTNGSPPAGTVGTYPALTKQGVVADVVGTGALTHSEQVTTNLKLAYDFTSWLRATYTFGFWSNTQTSSPQSYLTSTATGLPTFGSVSSFAGNNYDWIERHISNAVSLRSDTHGDFDFDFSVSHYDYLTDIQRNPFTVLPGTSTYTNVGKITRMDGTNWGIADLKGIWRPFGYNGPQEISFGIHGDQYYLNNPTYQAPVWFAGSPSGNGQLYSSGVGKTDTGGLWAQDAWKIVPTVKLTLGGRLETWQATDGYNLTTTTTSSTGAITNVSGVTDPKLHSTNFSPKASLSWDPNKDWNVTGSFGEAYRYPTVGELYAISTSGASFIIPNPNLTPEQVLSGEVYAERKWDDGRIRLTFFQDNTHNALISQTNTATTSSGAQTTVTSVANVASIRNRGIEFAAQKDNVLIAGLQPFGSVTYVDSRILSDPSWAGTNPLTGLPDSVVGKHVPYVPDWRATLGVTYRPDTHWSFTLAGRYSGKQYSTLDNTDIVSHVFGAFDRYLVIDTRIHYEATDNLSFSFGIDNLNNEKYFLYHPFPGRTFIADARVKF